MSHPEWTIIQNRILQDWLHVIRRMLDTDDPRPAREQVNDNYPYGGGWQPFPGFTLAANNNLLYPGDPPMRPRAYTQLRDEQVVLYDHDWIAIIQPDRSFEVARMD